MDTIFSSASGPQKSAIKIIRVSGSETKKLPKIFSFKPTQPRVASLRKIYDLNYDFLVMNPKQEIKSLIFWLGWKWDDNYLTPHLNPRSVSTASNVQVRSPINTKSLRGWQKYKKMLKPAMEIITQNDKYKDLKY